MPKVISGSHSYKDCLPRLPDVLPWPLAKGATNPTSFIHSGISGEYNVFETDAVADSDTIVANFSDANRGNVLNASRRVKNEAHGYEDLVMASILLLVSSSCVLFPMFVLPLVHMDTGCVMLSDQRCLWFSSTETVWKKFILR